MLAILVSLFIMIAVLSFLEERLDRRLVGILMIVIGLAMAFTAGLRPEDIDHDHSNYISMYNHGEDVTTEISFICIASFVRATFDNVVVVFLIYALISITLKLLAIKRTSDLYFLTLLVYLSTFYLLHDFNQIRVGVATGFMLLGLPYLKRGSRLKFILLLVGAVLFHYSAIILLFLLFFDYKPLKRWQYIFYGSIIPVCYLMYFMHVNVFYMVPIPYFEEKMEAYEEIQHTAEAYDVNVFNLLLLTKIIIVYFLIYYGRLIEKKNEYFPILLKIEVFSISAFILFTEVPILSFRVNELLGVVEILLFPMLYYAFKPKWVANGVVVLMALVLFMIDVFYSRYIYV